MLAADVLRIVFGLAAVIGMIGACAFLARKAGLSNLAGLAGNKRRLAISETMPLDARRRLAIVRCDDLEYLIVLGPTGETVVASGMTPVVCEETVQPVPVNPFAELGGFAQKLRAASGTLSKKNAA